MEENKIETGNGMERNREKGMYEREQDAEIFIQVDTIGFIMS